MELTNTALAPLLLRNILLPILIFTDHILSHLTHKFKLFQFIRYVLITCFLFFVKYIPLSFYPSGSYEPESNADSGSKFFWIPFLTRSEGNYDIADISNDKLLPEDTCIARALSQLLTIINEIPVSSRKYEVARSYAEKLMNENLEEKYEPLRRVNSKVLGSAFASALGQLEVAITTRVEDGDGAKSVGLHRLNRVLNVAWTRFRSGRTGFAGSAEKLAAELLWLAEKLAACGSGDEAVKQWASANKLASAALSAQLRLQGSLVKLTAYLFKQAASMGGEDDKEGNMEELRKIKMRMLMSWLPFLCRASIGTDAPVLSFNEKVELENVLGELIGSLKHEEEQEKVLSLWLHHFTHCPSSDWPNLHVYYARWCTTSRKLLILEGKQH
ncbi:hypothetical protein CTI12_AA362830 [Artemisia annua]|uniref:Uncharacterized protein n=1 Tax=Artemisia annua TaxID=35608 RepID=A0A2U1MMR7_ARTAN|nr:hypothetical protein CTI12_AA362830 [Artemisia annua]